MARRTCRRLIATRLGVYTRSVRAGPVLLTCPRCLTSVLHGSDSGRTAGPEAGGGPSRRAYSRRQHLELVDCSPGMMRGRSTVRRFAELGCISRSKGADNNISTPGPGVAIFSSPMSIVPVLRLFDLVEDPWDANLTRVALSMTVSRGRCFEWWLEVRMVGRGGCRNLLLFVFGC